jgi:hypothetical protein
MGWRAQDIPKFRRAVPGSLEAAPWETIAVKLHDLIYLASGADTFDPHLRRNEQMWWEPCRTGV